MATCFLSVVALPGCEIPIGFSFGPGTIGPFVRDQFSVEGFVRDARTGQPLDRAVVEVMDGTFVGRRARTNEFGQYRMHELVGGMTLRASKKGYRSRSMPITLTACQSESSDCVGTHQLDFELRPQR